MDKEKGVVLWDELAANVRLAVHFLDDVVTANNYIPKVPELKAAAWRGRRIGLGFMGLADLLYITGKSYGAESGLLMSAAVAEWMQYHAMLASIDLAKERSPFPAITGSIFDPRNITWKPPARLPEWLAAGQNDDWCVQFGRPKVDWNLIMEGIKAHGIRNAAFTTVAPTGTIGTAAGVEGYGVEPVFAISYKRYVNQGDEQVELHYASKLFEWGLDKWGIPRDAPEVLAAIENETLAGDTRFSDDFRSVFVTAGDIPPIGHVRMQAVVQHYFSNSISKTINLPVGSTKADVVDAYINAWKLGCRGITVYVAESRKKEVLVRKKK